AVLVLYARVRDNCVFGAALDFVTDNSVVKIAVVDRQGADFPHVQIVGKSRTVAVMSEFAVIDRYAAGRIEIGEQALLVIMEVVAVEDEIAVLVADPSTVTIVYLCARE